MPLPPCDLPPDDARPLSLPLPQALQSDDRLLIRPALPADTEAVGRMIQRSYRALLAEDYPAELLREALPLIGRPRPGVLTCGTYFIAEIDERVLAGGGWTDASPLGAPGRTGEAHIRHVATDPDAIRRGLGRRVIGRVMRSARAAGVRVLHVQATLTSAPFYAALGFEPRAGIELRLPNGLLFPAIQMRWEARGE
ncbi:GNAT family N-acetyltransferase [Pseudooceanicola sp. CBS1P-1]|uniref:GNAT family N-acetyltransferase n=1 Tax=Pseudooceanicola albus TaxID=2692189 RepID=A0A6L7G4E7_9RHOB|nr:MULTISPECIES: GNAT family N-acetyltransferase [Pseudooceanicola]MBT9384697.1 GNAT family N-acetyltransferase [Pseudooceanicola endophyticus]MXN18398.1 GNAT family N-acetyltransferase [Pseudooceanicola albus]